METAVNANGVMTADSVYDHMLNSHCDEENVAREMWTIVCAKLNKQPTDYFTFKSEHNKLKLMAAIHALTVPSDEDLDNQQSSEVYQVFSVSNKLDLTDLNDLPLKLLIYLYFHNDIQVRTSYDTVFDRTTEQIKDGWNNSELVSKYETIVTHPELLYEEAQWSSCRPLDVCMIWAQLCKQFPSLPRHPPLINYEILRAPPNNTYNIVIVEFSDTHIVGITDNVFFWRATTLHGLFSRYLNLFGITNFAT